MDNAFRQPAICVYDRRGIDRAERLTEVKPLHVCLGTQRKEHILKESFDRSADCIAEC